MTRNQNIITLFTLAVVITLAGCAGIGQKTNEYGDKIASPFQQTPTDSDQLSVPYQKTVLGYSTSAQVLEDIVYNSTETISQSESVIGAYGVDKKRKRAWFNIVAFDEEALIASRKYFLSTYDRPKSWFYLKEKLRFDTELYIGRGILDDAYANADAKRIAILAEVRRIFNADIRQLEKYNRDMANIGMLVNQSLNVILNQFKINPAYAEQMEYFNGLDFDHPTLNDGKIRIVIDDETGLVKVKIKIGTIIKTWGEQKDVIAM